MTADMRIAIVGNSGGGKSTIARRLAERHGLPRLEVDDILWTPAWEPVSDVEYNTAHDAFVARESWLIDGVGRLSSLKPRLDRATWVIVTDFPLWQHFWLAIERQIAWHKGELADTPSGNMEPPSTWAVCENIWIVDRDWMPHIRRFADQAEGRGAKVTRLGSVEVMQAFSDELAGATPA